MVILSGMGSVMVDHDDACVLLIDLWLWSRIGWLGWLMMVMLDLVVCGAVRSCRSINIKYLLYGDMTL